MKPIVYRFISLHGVINQLGAASLNYWSAQRCILICLIIVVQKFRTGGAVCTVWSLWLCSRPRLGAHVVLLFPISSDLCFVIQYGHCIVLTFWVHCIRLLLFLQYRLHFFYPYNSAFCTVSLTYFWTIILMLCRNAVSVWLFDSIHARQWRNDTCCIYKIAFFFATFYSEHVLQMRDMLGSIVCIWGNTPAKKSWIIHELFMNYFMSKFMNNSWIIHQH